MDPYCQALADLPTDGNIVNAAIDAVFALPDDCTDEEEAIVREEYEAAANEISIHLSRSAWQASRDDQMGK